MSFCMRNHVRKMEKTKISEICCKSVMKSINDILQSYNYFHAIQPRLLKILCITTGCDYRWEILPSPFHHVMKWPCFLSLYFKPSVYLCWLLCILFFLNTAFPIQYCSKGLPGSWQSKINNYRFYHNTTPVLFMFTCCLF